jgi:hypothetical protein
LKLTGRFATGSGQSLFVRSLNLYASTSQAKLASGDGRRNAGNSQAQSPKAIAKKYKKKLAIALKIFYTMFKEIAKTTSTKQVRRTTGQITEVA